MHQRYAGVIIFFGYICWLKDGFLGNQYSGCRIMKVNIMFSIDWIMKVNIFVLTRGLCCMQVVDFGLARIASDNNTHVSTRVMGTFGKDHFL
jgi:hypothetical protein